MQRLLVYKMLWMQQLRLSLRFSLSTLQAGAAALTKLVMKGTAVALAVMLCTTIVQGVPMFKGGRCLCIGSGVKAVRLANIEKVSIMYPSNNCDRVEVIITLKQHRGQRCLDPRSKQAHLIRQHYEKKNFLKHRNI